MRKLVTNHVGAVTYNIWEHVAVVGANSLSSFPNLDFLKIFYRPQPSADSPLPTGLHFSIFIFLHL